MNSFIAVLFAVALIPASLHAQDDDRGHDSSIRFLPGRQLVPPLLAHPVEPRTGVRLETGSSRLKLDIGAPFDLLHIRLGGHRDRLAVGALIFAYGLTTSADGLRLQVSALDGFFGGHLTVALPRDGITWVGRLRLLHQSGHLVDGAYDKDAGGWSGGREPIPYTRDFGELTIQMLLASGATHLRAYGGGSYTTHLRPEETGRFAALGGLEVLHVAGELLGRSCCPYLAWNIALGGRDVWTASHALEGGVRLGDPAGAGLRLYGGLFTGTEVFSQYYDRRRTSWGVGFAFDLW